MGRARAPQRHPRRLRILFLFSDEHSRKVYGAYGNRRVRTPNLDRLAALGKRFSAGYTNSPICVPARAALATGRYVFDIGCWDNASPYTGIPQSWAHHLRRSGMGCVAVGKLHYRHEHDDTGFTEQILPMHLHRGIGDVLGAVRDPVPERSQSRLVATEIGPGESTYTQYDRRVTDAACAWLARHAARDHWLLFVGWVAPHFPLIAPPEFFSLYPPAEMPLPKACSPQERPAHPWLEALRGAFITDRYFSDETRRVALAAYYGLVSFLDHNVGRVLRALESAGVARDTLVVYASDHGDNLGARGLWGKSTMYEEAAGIPLTIAGPGVAAGGVERAPVSLVDVFPTFLDATDLKPPPELRGASLLRALDPARPAFAEYHAAGAATGAFMLRSGPRKYVHYTGMAPQLFDLSADPEELRDLAPDRRHAGTLSEMERTLRGLCAPEDVDRRAKRDQAQLVERHGGREKVIAAGGFGATPVPAV